MFNTERPRRRKKTLSSLSTWQMRHRAQNYSRTYESSFVEQSEWEQEREKVEVIYFEMSLRQSKIHAEIVVWEEQIERALISIAVVRKTFQCTIGPRELVYIEKLMGPSTGPCGISVGGKSHLDLDCLCHVTLDPNQSSVASEMPSLDREGRRICHLKGYWHAQDENSRQDVLFCEMAATISLWV